MTKFLLPYFALIVMAGLLFPVSSKAQTTEFKGDTADYPYWIEMMQDPDANFYATQSAFYKYWANPAHDPTAKGRGYKVFKRWEYHHETHLLPDGKRRPDGAVYEAYQAYMAEQPVKKMNSSSCDWTVVGPTSYPVNNTGQPTGMGRINAITFHPTDPNIIYVGAASGGIWKSTNAGTTWTNISGALPTMGVSAIVVDPTDPNIIYIGSGDRDSDDALALGVFKSTDGGATWVQMNNTMGNARVGALAMDPNNHLILIAATNTGLFKTSNGGSTWSMRVSGSAWKDVKYKPGSSSILYAAYGGSLWRSSNGGESGGWTTPTLPVTGGRIVIGVTPADPDVVYLAQANASNQTFAGLMRSGDSGVNFTLQSTSPNIFDIACDGSGAGSQAFYDLCIAVDPTNANTVYVGCINNWKSTNAGTNWSIISHWVGSNFSNTACPGVASMHADQHALAWSPDNAKLYFGNDGGVYWTSNGGTSYTEVSNGLNISQVYKISQSATIENLVLHGYQDNGSASSVGNNFATERGGDGFECIIDYSNSAYRYNTYVAGAISRSTGGSYINITATSNGITEAGAFSTPFVMHVTDPNTLFGGYKNVFRTNNAKASSASAVSWSAISTGETTTCRVVRQSVADPNILYVVRSGQVKRTDNANAAAGSVTWTSCALPGGYTPTDIETHPTNANIVYATANYGVYKSTDKGATWTDISGNLPSLFTNCLKYDKNTNEGLYVGNETSIWYKDAGTATWMLCSAGLPPVDIREIDIYYDNANPDNSRMKVATYGRGTWSHVLPSAPPVLNCATLTTINLTTESNTCVNNTDLTAPVAVDNCDGNISGVGSRSDLASMTSPWPIGTTTITWTFTDNVGSTIQCTQQVTVTDNQAPTIGTCPLARTVTGCNTDAVTGPAYSATSANSSYTVFSNGTNLGIATDNCNLTTVSYQDAVSGSCPMTVTRTWTVGDGTNTNTCAQTITIAAPAVTYSCPADHTEAAGQTQAAVNSAYSTWLGTFSFGGGCGAASSNNNTGAPSACGGSTVVTWTVTSTCEAAHTCSATFTVSPASVTPSISGPSTVCIGGSITLTAGAGYTAYAWSNGGGNAQSATYSNITTNSVYTVTVTNSNTCTGTGAQSVTVQVCQVIISGTARWEHNNAGVANATVTTTGSYGGTATTNSSGFFTNTWPGGGNFTIKPAKNLNLLNGVTIADATAIQQHVVGQNPLSGPYKRIAADVNRSNSINTTDASLVNQAILGNPGALAVFNVSWRFVPASYSFPNPNVPWGFPETIVLSNVLTNQTNQDFVGVKIGDVNGSGNPALTPLAPLVLTTEDRRLNEGETATLTFNSQNFNDLAAYQAGFDIDPTLLQVVSVEPLPSALDLAQSNFGLDNLAAGDLRTAWSVAQGISVPDGTPLFRIQVKALADNIQLSSVIHLSETESLMPLAFNTALEAGQVKLVFNSLTGTQAPNASGLSLLQNKPNPFSHETVIGFVMPNAGEAQLRIFDHTGRLIAQRNRQYGAGYQEESFVLEGVSGLLYYELITPYGTLSKKMIGL